jgi:hypothetical protein
MRVLILAILGCAGWAPIAWPADTAVITHQIRLDSPDALARLRATNPDHYARAQRIIAAANKLCAAKAAKQQFVELDSGEVSCGILLETSNPPKREVSFKLDATRYVAVVVITDSPPQVVNAH